MLSYDKFGGRFINACQMRYDVDYGNKASVRRYNKGMSICRKVMKQIDIDFSDMLEDFTKLLSSQDSEVRYMSAFCLLEIAHPSVEQEQQALERVCEFFDIKWRAMAREMGQHEKSN